MVFEQFTDRAKRAVAVAEREANELGSDYIGTEHLLLGVAEATDGVGGEVLGHYGVVASQARTETARILDAAGVSRTGGRDAVEALASIGIDVTEIRRRADQSFGPGRFRFPRPPFTPRAKKVLELSLREARALSHDEVGTEHLLLGILAEGEGVALTVLNALGVDVSALRPAVLARITPS